MNEMAAMLGLQNTHFTNPIGFDDQKNYASARDSAILASAVIDDQKIADIVARDTLTIVGNNGAIVHNVVNTNPFIGQTDVAGIKTGTSPTAGENLITLKSFSGRPLIFVVIGSNDRVRDMERLFVWAESAYYF
jgi:D-alanyl-D-alanine carboxypeptidase (penicillin-binding protein 5/6)